MENQLVRRVLLKRNRNTLLAVAGVILAAYLVSVINQFSIFEQQGAMVVASILGSGDATLFVCIVAVFFGLATFLVDGQTHFNEFLFALPVRKARIYWQKVRLFWETLILSTIVGMLLYYGSIFMLLPASAVKSSLWSIIWNCVSQLGIVSFIFILSLFAGMIIGRPVLAVFTVLGFWIGFVFFWEGINYLAAGLLGLIRNQHIPANYSDILLANIRPTTFTGALSLVAIIGVMIVGFLWWGQHLFNQLSLENNGRFLLFANYRLALLLVFTGFMIVAISFSDLIQVPMSLVGFYPKHLTLTIRLVMAVLTGVISWLFGRWIIYRPDHFKTIFSFKGLTD